MEERAMRGNLRVALVGVVIAWAIAVPVWADDGQDANGGSFPWPAALAWLVPVGLGLVACGAVPPTQASAVIRVGWLALGTAVIGYWLCGFAFQFGALGFTPGVDTDLSGLVRQWGWAPMNGGWGTRWGMLGLTGYMLRGPASTPVALRLFLAQLPWITTAVAIPLWSLQGRTRPIVLWLSGLLAAFVYALLGNWAWGGGWLANLGLNLGLGHGFVDLAGAGAVHLAGATAAFAGMLAFGVRAVARPGAAQLALPTLDQGAPRAAKWTAEDEPYVPMPPFYLPTLATLGAWLALIGWIGWVLSAPTAIAAGLDISQVELAISLALAAGGGAAASLLYCWLTTGQGNALMAARGVLGALVAASAGAAFLPTWGALAVGAGAGLLVPLVQYTVEHVLRLDDATSVVATHGIPALWGLLAVGVLADGHAGQGWNLIGTPSYLNVPGQGITGYLAGAGFLSDWPGQFQAQLAGTTAMCVAAFFLPWLLFAAVQGLTKAWQGEYTIRLPARRRTRRARTGTRLVRPRVRVVRAPVPEAEAPQPAGSPASQMSRNARRLYRYLQDLTGLRKPVRSSSPRIEDQEVAAAVPQDPTGISISVPEPAGSAPAADASIEDAGGTPDGDEG
jgi:Amt family ammonium transporter